MNFVIIGGLVVLLIVFAVLVWKASKQWRWYQILPVVLTMFLSIAFLFPTAMVLKSRSAWHAVKEKLDRQLLQAEEEFKLLKNGDGETTEGARDLSIKLAKLGIEAGRSWRGLSAQGGDSNRQTLNAQANPAAPVIPGDAAAPAQDPAPLVPQGLVVYAFAETMDPATQIPVPTFYLGEFVVEASMPNSVTVVPTGPLDPAQKVAIDQGQASQWSLYELLPLDGHEAFLAEVSLANDDNLLGRVDEELVGELFEGKVSEATLKRYRDDGRRATDNDPPLSRWSKIEFVNPHSIQVDSPEQRGALDGGFFDGNGRAVDARLQHGESGSVQFKKGDQIVLQEIPANRLIESGTAKLLDRFYLRPLNDYRYILRHIQLRITQFQHRTADLEKEAGILKEAIDKSNGMIVVGNDIKIKLEQDLAQFEVENESIRKYHQKLQKSLAERKKEMGRLYKQNIALEQRLREIHRSIQQSGGMFTATN